MAIDVSGVVTEHGAVYRAGGQGVKDIQAKFFQPLESEQYFKVLPTDKTVIDKSHATITRVVQRFQTAFTAISTTTLTPEKIILGHLKIDLEESPDAIESDWHGFLASNSLSRKDWPFVKWWLQELVMKQELQDYELNEFYKGEEGTITPGIATAAGRSINGLRHQLNNRAGVNSIAMGAWPTNASADQQAKERVEYIEDWFKQIPRLHRRRLDVVFVNEDILDEFRQGMTVKYNTNWEQVPEARQNLIRRTNVRVVGLPSMDGDDKIFTIMPELRMSYAKKPENQNFFKVEEAKRKVAVMTDYWRLPTFLFPQYAYQNDLETTTLYP